MEREIKFRGIYTDINGNKKWVYGDLVHGKKITQTGLENKVSVGGYPVDANTVGQYTGIKDINGKEIFDDDIVISHKNAYKCSDEWCKIIKLYWHIYYFDGSFLFEFIKAELNEKNYKEYDKLEHKPYDYISNTDYRDLEIIGNKFDNPELLKP